MGIFSSLKKLFFAGESVAKSASEKAGETILEEGGKLMESGKSMATDIGNTVMDKTSGLKDAILDKSSDLMESGKGLMDKGMESITQNETLNSGLSKMDELGKSVLEKGSQTLADLGESAENLGEKLQESGKAAMDKFGEVSEKLGSEILDKGGKLSENVGEKVLQAKDAMVEKANEIGGQMKEKFDETMEKAETFAEEQKNTPDKPFADDTLDASGSLLEGQDDFFAKADQFAKGNYDAVNEGKIEISSDEGNLPENPISKAAGFTDHDGDGNELIDDAIISEEE